MCQQAISAIQSKPSSLWKNFQIYHFCNVCILLIKSTQKSLKRGKIEDILFLKLEGKAAKLYFLRWSLLAILLLFILYLLWPKMRGKKPALHLVYLIAHIHSVLSNGNFVWCAVVSIGVSHNKYYTFTHSYRSVCVCVCVCGGGGGGTKRI